MNSLGFSLLYMYLMKDVKDFNIMKSLIQIYLYCSVFVSGCLCSSDDSCYSSRLIYTSLTCNLDKRQGLRSSGFISWLQHRPP